MPLLAGAALAGVDAQFGDVLPPLLRVPGKLGAERTHEQLGIASYVGHGATAGDTGSSCPFAFALSELRHYVGF